MFKKSKLILIISTLLITGCNVNKDIEYSFALEDYNSNKLVDVEIRLIDSKGNETKYKSITNSNGVAVINAKEGNYKAKFVNMPNKLRIVDNSVKSSENTYIAYPFLDTSNQIPEEGSLDEEGMTFHDFSVNLIKSDIEYNLAEDLINYDVVLINFWATWCTPCMSEMRFIDQLNNKYENVSVISLNIDDDEEAIYQAKARSLWKFNVAKDYNNVFNWTGRTTIPTNYLIDKYGTVVEIEEITFEDLEQLEELIRPYIQDNYNPWTN